ncbi:hypothetical protein [Sinosporangium siamense]|uniref:Cysteinyl-tRNA synthetase n=1 Tax=Sinosporangium siamense TaxID=1367973 RepID=A0A919V6N9_9ACTN|nr:hypothetical protein [Sinosporangium siamense]GII91202.1 hypothetical protein Ssi02_14330 [Sinosporangium siamense]
MAVAGGPGLLVLMGSGETSPTMVGVHRTVVGRLPRRPGALLLDTPYAFQENAKDISARARHYFARSVGLVVDVMAEDAAWRLREADWVFSGPGSPTYAMERWKAASVAGELRERIAAGRGVTVLASAAACTAGLATVPVYEIYKVGSAPYWAPGLDLLGEIGLRAVVIPHYDNTEGGTHDTRFCYLGERRLAAMEAELPDAAAILGVDEHTAVVLDFAEGTAEVMGRGGLTIRRREGQTVLPHGTLLTLAGLRALADGSGAPDVTLRPVHRGEREPRATLAEVLKSCEGRFDTALRGRDPEGMTGAVLDLENEIATWAADTEEDDGGVDQARDVLRHLIARMGRTCDPRDRRERLTPVADPMIALRARLRAHGDYRTADAVRAALSAIGVVVHDTADGPRWSVR